jgi:RimJ/RimL family protein N-acetyltransferase
VTALPLEAGRAVLRGWELSDRDSLVREASDRAVWRNMIHTFPHPYTPADADTWIAQCMAQEQPRDVVIDVNGRLAGVCGITLWDGVSRYTASVGYWLGQRYWNQGIATQALARFLQYIWDTFDVERLQAEVFAWNPASARVLEKNGFILEGTRRKAIFKDGELIDEWMYTQLRSDGGR